VPVEQLGERAAEQQAERAAGDRGEHPGAHGLGALRGLGELGDDDRQDHRGLHRGADTLKEAGADQQARAVRDAAEQRGDGEHGQPGEEHPLAPGEVAEAAGEQQEAAEGDQEGVDDPGQAALAEVQVVLDLRECDIDDAGVNGDHQLRQADRDQREPPAPVV
jgi:hypothetical protein